MLIYRRWRVVYHFLLFGVGSMLCPLVMREERRVVSDGEDEKMVSFPFFAPL